METTKKVFLSTGVLSALGWFASDVMAFTRKRAAETATPDEPEDPAAQIALAPAMPDLTAELAALLSFSGKIAIAIRQQTIDAPRETGEPVSTDLGQHMWLIECLHRFAGLGQAIEKGTAHEIMSLCDDLLAQYRDYRVIDRMHQRLAKAGPDAERFSITDAMKTFDAIRTKVSPLTYVL